MARAPRSHPSTAELDAQIAELQVARDAEIARLYERRREAEREEHRMRGQLLVTYLAGRHGAAILDALRPAVAPRDRHLFGFRDGGDERPPVGVAVGAADDGGASHAPDVGA